MPGWELEAELPPRGTPAGLWLVSHLQDEGGEDAVGLGANNPRQQHAPGRNLWSWR